MNASVLQARPLSLHASLFAAAVACALALCAIPAPAQAAVLTGEQMEAVTGILSAYNVPQETIDDVGAVLNGQSKDAASAAAVPAAAPASPAAYAPVPPMPPMPPAPVAYRPGLDASSLVASAAMVPMSATADSLNLIADQVIEINYAIAGVLSAYVDLFALDTIAQAAAATVAPPVAHAQGSVAGAGESLWTTLSYLPQSLYETAGDTTDFLAAVEMAPLHVITDGLSNALFKAGLY